MKFNPYKAVAVIWTLITLGLSSIPSKSIPRSFLNEIFGIDKIAHIIFYLTMTVAWALYMRGFFNIRNALRLSMLMSASFGIMMEIYQKVYFIDRSFDWADAMANIVGVILGRFLFIKYEKLFPIFAKP